MKTEGIGYNIEQVKEQVINTSLVVASIVGALAYFASFLSRFQTGNFNYSILFETIVLLTLLFVTIRKKYIVNSIKAYIMVALILFLSLSDALFYGLLSSTRVYLVLVPLYSIIYFPFIRSLIFYLIAIVGFVLIGYFHYTGHLVLPLGYEPDIYVLKMYPWIVNAIHISAVGLIILYVTRKFFMAFSGLIIDLEDQNVKISENDRNYREIFNSTAEAIFIHNANDGQIYDVNEVMLKMYGLDSKDEALRLSIKDISANNDKNTLEKAQFLIKKAVNEGPQVFEWSSKRKNGELFYSEISLKSTDIGGEGRVLAVVRDITDRKKMEQKIQESEERYRTLVETSQDGISLMDMSGVMLFVNSRKAQMLKAKESIDLVGQNAFNYLTKDSSDKVTSLMPKIIDDGHMNNLEAEVRRNDGSTFQAEFNVTILKDSSGQPRYMMDTMRDITERKLVEKALRDSEEKYRTLMENVNEVIMMVDNDDKVLYVNHRFTEKLGYTPDEIIGKIGYKTLKDPKYQEQIISENKRRTKGEVSQYEITFTSKRGEEIEFLVSGSPIKDEKGRTIGSLGAMIDITERNKTAKELENYKNHLEFLVKERTEELQTTNEELQSTNEELYSQREELEATLNKLQGAQRQLIHSEKMASLGVLAAGVAHEINNPLNFIKGGTAALEDFIKDNFKERSGELTSLLEIVNEGVNRATVIVSGLNHYSRRSDKTKTNCNLHTIIDNCILILSNQFKNRITVEKEYTTNPFIIKCNEGKMHQAILNILSNAVHAIEGKGTIAISTKLSDDFLNLIIADTGCGISDDNLSKIMDPFFTTKDPGEGTGLGLSITHNIIDEHGGSLDFESEIGKGTKVFVNLPLK